MKMTNYILTSAEIGEIREILERISKMKDDRALDHDMIDIEINNIEMILLEMIREGEKCNENI